MLSTLFDEEERYIQTVEKLVDKRLGHTSIKIENVEKVLYNKVNSIMTELSELKGQVAGPSHVYECKQCIAILEEANHKLELENKTI